MSEVRASRSGGEEDMELSKAERDVIMIMLAIVLHGRIIET